MTQATLIPVEKLHRLMRLMMEHQADHILVIEKARVRGSISRLSIMESLSEIRPEGIDLKIEDLASLEVTLQLLGDAPSATIPTVRSDLDFNALWSRNEILQAWGKIQQIKIWQPSATAIHAESTLPENPSRATIPRTEIHPPIYESQSQEVLNPTPVIEIKQPPPISKEPHRRLAESLHKNIERGRMAINTLAALDLPILASSPTGVEIFHNHAFSKLQNQFPETLNGATLVEKAKQIITRAALDGVLDVDEPIVIKAALRGYSIIGKAIRDYEDLNSEVQGYIFWLSPSAMQMPLTIQSNSDEVGLRNFSGKTLTDILAHEEKQALLWAMSQANNNQSDAALLLGMPRQTFNYRYRKMLREQNKVRKT